MSHEPDIRSDASDWTTIDARGDLLVQLFDSDTSTLKFGPFRVIEEIDDRGSSSTVFKAKHDTTGELVALKVLDLTIGWHRAKERFDHEVAQHKRLDHPNIARVLDSGSIETASGRRVPWLAVELVEGGKLTEHVKSCQLNNHQVIELVIQICRAVGHAHKMGLVHRDLKPANICITKEGQPKLIDFGLVRDVMGESGPTLHTAQGVLIGTPAYMAPEQAMGDHTKVGPRSDVYSIAAMLFELLTGVLPVPLEEGLPIPQAVTKIVNSPSRSLRKFGDGFDARLDAIMGKALAKAASARYETASELGDDLQAYLDKQPLTVKPPSLLIQMKRGVKEHRKLTLAVCMIFCFLSILALVSRVKEQRAQAAEAAVATMERRTRRDLANQYVKNAWEASDNARPADALVWITEALKLEDEPDLERIRRLQYASIRAMSPRIVKQEFISDTQMLVRHRDLYVVFDSAPGRNSMTRVYRDGTADPIFQIERTRGCYTGAFSPDGKILALAFESNKDKIGALEFIDMSTGLTFKNLEFNASVKSIDFKADGSQFCIALWDIPDNTEGDDGRVQIIQSDNFAVVREFVAPNARLTCAEWSPDETKIAAGSIDDCVFLFDVESGDVLNSFELPNQTLLVRFSPDGQSVVVSDAINDCQVWNVSTGKPTSAAIRLNGGLYNATLNEDSTELTILTEGLRTVWELKPDPARWRRFEVPPDTRSLRLSPDSDDAVLSTSPNGESPFGLTKLDLSSGQLFPWTGSFPDIVFEWMNNREIIVSQHTQEQTRVVDAITGQTTREICRQSYLNQSDMPSLRVFPDHQLAAVPVGLGYAIYNHKTGELTNVNAISNATGVELSSDGKTLYFSRTGKNAAVVAVNYPEMTVKWEQPMSVASRCVYLRLSQDQRLVMAALTVEGLVEVFDAATGKPIGRPIFSSKAWLGWIDFLGTGDNLALNYGSIHQLSIHDSRTGALRFSPIRNASAFRSGPKGSNWIWIGGPKSYLMDGRTGERLTPSYGNEVMATPNEDQALIFVEDLNQNQLIRHLVVPDTRPRDELLAEAQLYSQHALDATGELVALD